MVGKFHLSHNLLPVRRALRRARAIHRGVIWISGKGYPGHGGEYHVGKFLDCDRVIVCVCGGWSVGAASYSSAFPGTGGLVCGSCCCYLELCVGFYSTGCRVDGLSILSRDRLDDRLLSLWI